MQIFYMISELYQGWLIHTFIRQRQFLNSGPSDRQLDALTIHLYTQWEVVVIETKEKGWGHALILTQGVDIPIASFGRFFWSMDWR